MEVLPTSHNFFKTLHRLKVLGRISFFCQGFIEAQFFTDISILEMRVLFESLIVCFVKKKEQNIKWKEKNKCLDIHF